MSHGEVIAERIRTVRFTPVRIREGYDMGEVDDFLDQVTRAALSGMPLAPLVAHQTFGRVTWREGYDIQEVEDFLMQIAPGSGRPDIARSEQPAVIQEQRGVLGRLFKRG